MLCICIQVNPSYGIGAGKIEGEIHGRSNNNEN